MDLDVHSPNENIRKIEDIIDIQKANGNFNVRQVAFKLPSESESKVSANVAKSLESGLTKSISDSGGNKKFKKLRSKRHKSPLPDVISWPSDSDITVLRMKLCLSNDVKEKVGNNIPGDGLHQPDSSSMTNLATLIRQSQPASKHSLNIEEYLMPLTSWEREQDHEPEPEKAEPNVEEAQPNDYNIAKYKYEFFAYEPKCSRQNNEIMSSKDSQSGYSKLTKKSKMARFLRLYFCPCCTCLYRLETMRDEPSTYFSKRTEMY